MENAISAPKERKKWLKKAPKREIRVVVYLTEQEANDYAEEACKVGVRSRSAKLFVQKPHGFANETELNTKGISKFIRRFMFPAWKKAEITRLQKLQEGSRLVEEAGGKVIIGKVD